MHVVYSAKDTLDAYLAKAILMDNGVESHIIGEYLQGGIGELPASGFVQLAVAKEDAEAAEKILREHGLK